jgi:hypothetical protein
VAFLKFSRDKRGYEHFFLVQPTTRRGKTRERILYWFRTPPGVRVGRLPFSDTVRRGLETQFPDVSFDWTKLLDTPPPPPAPDVERWRERRRAERAAKHAVRLEAAADVAGAASEDQGQTGALPSESAVADAVKPPDEAASSRRRRRRRGGRSVTTESAASRGDRSVDASAAEAMPTAIQPAEPESE